MATLRALSGTGPSSGFPVLGRDDLTHHPTASALAHRLACAGLGPANLDQLRALQRARHRPYLGCSPGRARRSRATTHSSTVHLGPATVTSPFSRVRAGPEHVVGEFSCTQRRAEELQRSGMWQLLPRSLPPCPAARRSLCGVDCGGRMARQGRSAGTPAGPRCARSGARSAATGFSAGEHRPAGCRADHLAAL